MEKEPSVETPEVEEEPFPGELLGVTPGVLGVEECGGVEVVPLEEVVVCEVSPGRVSSTPKVAMMKSHSRKL